LVIAGGSACASTWKNSPNFYDHLCEIDLTGKERGIRPPLASLANVRSAIATAAPFLPGIYREQYYRPLDGALPHVMETFNHQV
jgi:hypothetical protein